MRCLLFIRCKMSSKKEPKYEAVDPKKEMLRQDMARAQFSGDMAEIEKNLTEYLQIEDPLIHNGKVVALVKRPSMNDMKKLVPPEMMKYANMKPEEIPEDAMKELNEKYEDFYYEKMAELIVKPKYTAAKWKEKANPWFMQLFWGHIENISQLSSGRVDSFLEQ